MLKQSVFDGKGRYPQSHQRKWLRVSATGDLSYIAADKHTFVSSLAIPLRDLRMIDPMVLLFYLIPQHINPDKTATNTEIFYSLYL